MFHGKVALVTGAARGLGRVTALAFARGGARVVMTDIDEVGGQETLRLLQESGGNGIFLLSDVRNESDVEEMVAKTVETYGRLDCAVNNAAVVRFAPIIDETTTNFDLHIDTNLRGVFNCMKYEIRQMLKNGGGAIVNQSSITGSLTGNPGESVYAATKGGVDGLTKSVALSTARRRRGILVHVHPVLPWNLKSQQPQLPRSEPDGLPTESSHLSRLHPSAHFVCWRARTHLSLAKPLAALKSSSAFDIFSAQSSPRRRQEGGQR